jgi:acetyltransferase-like isoleucine patch superfamily enzyme
MSAPVKNAALRRLVKFVADLRTPVGRDSRWERKNRLLRRAGLCIAARGVAIGARFRCLDGMEEGISIAEYANIGHDVHVWNFGPVAIGRFSMIAADVIISNGWHDKRTLEPASGPTRIGDGAWIGTGARIVGSVRIGDNAIVGAGSVVIRDVPPNSIAVGVPARVIGERELPERVWHLDGAWFSPQDFTLVAEAQQP